MRQREPGAFSPIDLSVRLFESHFDEVKRKWKGRYERRYGFWRSFVDGQALRDLYCGLWHRVEG